ncbi:hypothetical protein Mapa_013437 [Marchantia paleacea]|nr:hypothetical protein Mapa_013437 [Marchantia paleacea]
MNSLIANISFLVLLQQQLLQVLSTGTKIHSPYLFSEHIGPCALFLSVDLRVRNLKHVHQSGQQPPQLWLRLKVDESFHLIARSQLRGRASYRSDDTILNPTAELKTWQCSQSLSAAVHAQPTTGFPWTFNVFHSIMILLLCNSQSEKLEPCAMSMCCLHIFNIHHH